MALCIPLPDAPPVDDQDGDQWLFSDDTGHSDWVLCPEYLPLVHAQYAASKVYTVQRYPGMTAEQRDEAERDWLYNHSLRYHPSLSAAERNA
jgi:hypothetical protein